MDEAPAAAKKPPTKKTRLVARETTEKTPEIPTLKKKQVASQTSAKRKKKVVQPPPVRPPPPETESEDEYVAGDNKMDDDEDDQSSLLSSGKDDLEAVVENDEMAPQPHSDEEHERDDVRPTGAHSTVGTTEPRSANAVSRLPAGFDEGLMHIRGLSRAESMKNRQKHVADRVHAYVKSVIFRKIKFVNSDAMFHKSMTLVTDNENVPAHQQIRFHMLYKCVFNEALNTKKGSCKQAGGKIVRETWLRMKEAGEEFFTLEELTKLRRATTDCKRKAFFLFFGNFWNAFAAGERGVSKSATT